MNNQKSEGFSLIELMVVIAIIAILAAVAVPAYNSYKVKASIAGARTSLESTIAASLAYYNRHGSFGTIQNYGLTPDAGHPTMTDLSNGYLEGDIAFISVGSNNPVPGVCNFETVSAYISNFGHGDAFLNPPGDVVLIQETLIDVNGTLVRRCSSGYAKDGDISSGTLAGGTTQTGSYVSNCPNIADDINYYNNTTTIIFNSC